MQISIPDHLLIAIFFPFFVGMWCFISFLISRLGGWNRLADIYPADGSGLGERYGRQSAKVGWANYGSVLTIWTSESGIRLSVQLLFRLFHPPIFIPWDAVFNATSRRILWFEYVAFDVGSPRIATMQLSRKVIEGYIVIDGESNSGNAS